MNHKINHGVILDNRPKEDLVQDYQGIELLAGAVQWQEKKDLKKVNRVKNQGQVGQCVAMTTATLLEIELHRLTGKWLELSPLSIYLERANQGDGMWVYDALDIAKKKGVSLEALFNSEGYNESQANQLKMNSTARAYAKALTEIDLSYLYLPINIDTIAQALDKGHGVGLILYANSNEYGDVPFVSKKLTWESASITHSITALDYTLYKGQKALWIVDSWGLTGIGGYRYITEDFLNERITTASYFDKFILDVGKTNKYHFTKSVQIGMRDNEIIKIQDFLTERGYFPVGLSTGYYGNITAQAVLKWQLDNKVDTQTELLRLGGNYWGQKSIAKANVL